ncbi:MAG: hypothetical protein ACTSPD_17710 [Promethearchaeota archaeon]
MQVEATMNQMRNSVYGLARFMIKNKINNVEDRLRRMGRNIARTFINYWKPTDIVNLKNIKDVISTIYQKILNSSVSINIDEMRRIITVTDYKCSLCKYKYNDIHISGCEIIIGLISEFISIINKESKSSYSIFLKPLRVKESKAYGNKLCALEFEYNIEE